MSLVWPSYARVGADREMSHTNDTKTEEYDDGFIAQYRRYSEAFVVRSVTARLLSDADQVRFREWVAAYGWRPHKFYDGDDRTWRMAFIEGGSAGVGYRPILSGELRTWEAEMRVVGLLSETTTAP